MVAFEFWIRPAGSGGGVVVGFFPKAGFDAVTAIVLDAVGTFTKIANTGDSGFVVVEANAEVWVGFIVE